MPSAQIAGNLWIMRLGADDDWLDWHDFRRNIQLRRWHFWKRLLVGGVAGAISRTLVHPLDRVRVALAVNPVRRG